MFTAIYYATLIIEIWCNHISQPLCNAHQRKYLFKLMDKYMSCDYSILESERGQTMYQKALNAITTGGDYGTGISAVLFPSLKIAAKILSFFLYTGILAYLNPVLSVIIIALSVIDAAALKYARKYENTIRDEYGDYLKKASYLEKASGDVKAGKDLRIFAMSERFEAIWKKVIDGYRKVLWSAKMRHGMADAVNGLTTAARNLIVYAYLIWEVCNGDISISMFVLYFGAASQFSSILRGIMYFINKLNLASIQVSELREFLDLKSSDRGSREITDTSRVPDIEFRNVTFRYSGAKEPVLENFSLKIKHGEKIAVVGINGAGKTTVVKLLCGFYIPTEGDVLIDGVSTRDIKKQSLHKLYSVIFQDAMVLPFTIAENISMRTEDETDYERVWSCLEKADLLKKVREYPKTMSEKMTRELDENGIVLSGGEQQKLLMARALYKDAPVLILDEPTAALDPIAESETYGKFHSISENKTAIYISHRLASTRFCDKIVLISDRRISETGTHDELMAAGGEYARMFEVQQQYYK